MMNYYEVVEKLDLDSLFVPIVSGTIELPFLIEQTRSPYGFPPAMIPLWLEDIDFVGFWHHWFTNDRIKSLVLQMPELDYVVIERARSIRQLVIIYLYERLCSLGYVDSLAHIISSAIGFQGVAKLFTIFTANGPGLEHLLVLEEFNKNPPQSCTMSKNLNLTKEQLMSFTSFDFNELERAQFGSNVPEWFLSNDMEGTFLEFLKKKDYKSAWMTLNSSGWEFTQAKIAILKLSEVAGCPRFKDFAESWASLPHEAYGSY